MYTRSDGIILNFSSMVSVGGDSTDSVSDWGIVSDDGLWSSTVWSVVVPFITDSRVLRPERGARSNNQNLQLMHAVGCKQTNKQTKSYHTFTLGDGKM